MIPAHVGIIPDGNRRWARRVGLPLGRAYEVGYERLREVLYHLLDIGVSNVSVYAMSWDNFSKRSRGEVEVILRLAERGFRELLEDEKLARRGVRIRVIGERSVLPPGLRGLLARVEEETGRRGGPTLYIAFVYSSRREVERALELGRPPETLAMPPIDLIVRTGGARRLSDFFPLASTYAEFYFTDTLWPDFTIEEMDRAIEWFSRVERRYGR